MADPLLETKLLLPKPRREVVPRPRLSELLLRGSRGQVTLVSAPAGFGKTTLRGPVTDQAELHGLLAKVRDLGATLLSFEAIDADA